jgi:histidine triad (HIT) family protein
LDTIFTKIINKELKANVIFEDNDILAFEDIKPCAPFHILIIPKKKIRTVNEISSKDTNLIGKMFIVARDIASKNKITKDGYRLVINCDENGGQTVFHLHMHMLAGKKLKWPPG